MKIDLYLEGKPVELDSDFSLALTYSFSDLEDPAAITGDFSKEMTIKGTPANNALFGQIWRFDRKMIPNDATNLSIYFNASKRTDAQIVIGGAVLKSGYVKLTGISNSKGLIQYKIVFYSKLCEVLHTIMEQKLRDLPFPNDLLHTLNRQSVLSSWNTNTGVFQYLTYLMSNSGLYEEFESTKWIRYVNGTYVVEDVLNGVELDELAKGEYRSYYQRPALKIKPLIDLIAQEHGITLDPIFFNAGNPYYASSVMSLPRYTMSGFDEVASATDMDVASFIITPSNDHYNVIAKYKGNGTRFSETFSEEINIEGYGNKEFAIEFMFDVKCYTDKGVSFNYGYVGFNENTKNIQPFYPKAELIINGTAYKMTPYLPNGIGVLKFLNVSGNILTGEFFAYDGSGGQNYFYSRYRPGGNLQNNSIPVRFTINNLPLNAKTATISITFYWPLNGGYIFDADGSGETDTVYEYDINIGPIVKAPTTGVVNLDEYFPYTAGFTDKDATFSDFKKIRSGYQVTKKEIIDDELTTGEFLIDYCKLFGLLFTTDDSGKLSIISRNQFFNNPKIEDWTGKVDRSKQMEITPFTFDVSKFVMKYADGGTFYENYYQDKTGNVYGSQEIRTGYKFENNEKDIFEGTIFNTPITSKESSRVLVGNKMIFINDNRILPALFEKDGATRVQSDSKYHLLFYNGFAPFDTSRGNSLFVTDDIPQMLNEDIGGGQYCWIDTSTLANVIKLVLYPVFSTMDKSGKHSWLFSRPLENYAGIPSLKLPESATIYNRFWARYFEDVYAVDNKRMTCYVKLSHCDMNQLSFANFVRIDGAIWHPNKVIDYNPASDGPTKVELVQVRDISAYSGQDINNWYGIEFDTQNPDPACKRIGNPNLHRTLPIQNKMKGCLLDDNGNVVKYLYPQDWRREIRDGSRGQVMVELPMHYRKFETEGTKRRVMISEYPIEGFHVVPKKYVSAYEATVQRSTTTLASVVNDTADYRGGNNNAAWDGTYRSLLGRPATNINRTNFRAYARKRKAGSTEWNCMTYDIQKELCWLFVIEYATLNSQAGFNANKDINGYAQGGLGNGVTTWDWVSSITFNNSFPFVPCGHTDKFGNGSGEIAYNVLNASGNIIKTFMVNRYRGIENPFGHMWKILDGINVRISPNTDAGGDGLNKVFVTDNPALFNDTNYNGYSCIGNEERTDGYVKQIIFGKGGEIISKVVGGGSETYFCDKHWTKIQNAETLHTSMFGGAMGDNGYCGLFCNTSDRDTLNSVNYVCSRLCFIPKV